MLLHAVLLKVYTSKMQLSNLNTHRRTQTEAITLIFNIKYSIPTAAAAVVAVGVLDDNMIIHRECSYVILMQLVLVIEHSYFDWFNTC